MWPELMPINTRPSINISGALAATQEQDSAEPTNTNRWLNSIDRFLYIQYTASAWQSEADWIDTKHEEIHKRKHTKRDANADY